MKNKILFSLIVPITLISIFYGVFILNKKKKPNVLIISTCSLRKDYIGLYAKTSNSPNIDKTFANSFIFKNAITDMSWSNVSGFISAITTSELSRNGYKAIGDPWTDEERSWQQLKDSTPNYYFRSPKHGNLRKNRVSYFSDDLATIKDRVLNRKNWPFVLEVHNKIMHIPYMRTVRAELGDSPKSYLNDEAINFLDKYKQSSKNKETPFQFILFPESIPSRKKVGRINNKELLEKWSKSKTFPKELEIIKQVYAARLKMYDSSISELLSLYNDSELQKNTIVIFMGDHGEAFFEHGYMIHGETVFDEMISFPLLIRLPGQTKSVVIEHQFFQGDILDIVRKIITEDLDPKNFYKYLNQLDTRKFIFSRNCANNIHSIRYNNTWKLIQDLKKGQKQLFNLISDPEEKKDVYDVFPNESALLEENYALTMINQPKNNMIHACTKEGE